VVRISDVIKDRRPQKNG